MFRLLYLIYLSASLIFAQKLNFQQIGPEKGLDISQIFSLVQLDNNLIVAGTFGGGLYFFNGTQFIKMGVEQGLANNKITSLALSPGGDLWIGTRFGISKFDGYIFTNYNTTHGLSNNIVNRLYISDDGIVYAATNNGLDAYQPSVNRGEFENIYNGNIVFAIYRDPGGSIWAGTEKGLLIFSEGSVDSTRYKVFSGKRINIIQAGPANSIFVGTSDGLFLVNGAEVKKWDEKSGLISNGVEEILMTKDGAFWIGTNKGLSRISDGRISNYGEREGINNYAIWSMLEDNENNLWFGTDEGLFKLNSDKFEIFLDSEGNKIDAWYTNRDKWGTLWAGVHQKGVMKLDDGGFNYIKGNPHLENNTIDYIYQSRSGYLWFCGFDGIARYNGSVIEKFLPQSELARLQVNSVLETANGDTWFGTWESRLFKFSNNRLTFELEGEYPLVHLGEFRGNVYISTPGGLYMLDEDRMVIPPWAEPLKNRDVIYTQIYNENQLLLAVYEVGLIIASFDNNETVTLDTLSVEDGLNDKSVLALAVDGNSDIWVGTNKGINRIKLSSYNSEHFFTVNSFGYDDGIPGSELFQKSMYYDESTGFLWFGTISGLARFKPSEIRERVISEDVQFTSLTYTDGPRQYSITPQYLSNRLIGAEDIHLPVNESDISVSFAATHFRSPADIKYRYKINSGNWSRLSRQRDIILPNLQHGSYTLVVEAEGSWTTTIKPASLRFVIPTPFWSTIWFKLILAGVFILLMLWTYRIRTAASRQRQRELEERLNEREKFDQALKKQYREIIIQKERAEKSDKIKSEFLAQVSHEIRTPLQVMLNHTSLLKETCKDNNELMESFSIIDNSGSRLIRTIDSILNMSQIQAGALEIHPQKIDLNPIVQKITEEFRPHANAKNLQLSFNLYEGDSKATLDEYTVSHLVQNLIDNAIKYTDRGSVNILLDRNDDGKLFFEVRDTGIGISKEYLSSLFSPFSQEDSGYTRKFDGAGLGLSLVKNYCELNSAEIFVESEKGTGTTFTVVFNT